MAARPELTDDEIMEIGRELLAVEGKVTRRALEKKCRQRAGVDSGRCADVARILSAEIAEASAGAALLGSGSGETQGPREPVLPKEIHDAVMRLPIVIARAITDVRGDEVSRARSYEEALKAEHAEEVRTLRREHDEVSAALSEAEKQIAQMEVERDQAQARVQKLEQTQQQLEASREQAFERERQATEERTQAEFARQANEIKSEQACQAVEDLRDKVGMLRVRVAELEERANSTEKACAVAVAEKGAAVERANTAEQRAARLDEHLLSVPTARNKDNGRKTTATGV